MRLADTPAVPRAGGDAEAVPAGQGAAADGTGFAVTDSTAFAAGSTTGAANSAGSATPDRTDFAVAVAALAAAREAVTEVRDDLEIEDWPAPKRLAPQAVALAATAYRDGQEAGTARLMLLHDPAGQEGWTATFRVVVQVHADVEEEMAADPMLGEVGWSWLTDALDLHAPGYGAPSGTVTRVITEGYGGKADEPLSTGFELRASWCPDGDQLEEELGGAVFAWCDLLAAAAGLPAQPPGTRILGRRGPGRGAGGRGGSGRGGSGHGAGGHGAGHGRHQ
jgi:hypothetical protein